MNKDIAEGKWNQFKGKVKERWGDFTDDEIDQIQGQRDIFVGLVQERYGVTKDEAEKQFDEFKAQSDLD